VPKDREFLVGATVRIWLTDDLDLWETALRRPVWPLRLGRSQDLASARTRRIELGQGPGQQGQAILPKEATKSGTLLRLPTAISEDRSRTRWDDFRYSARGVREVVDTELVTGDGQAVALLPPTHPALIDRELAR
jgi:hypothetical protein